ncbi:MAG: hypothetical protein K8S18_12620 [Desulfobacula sp.]|nr:hypothetical protein [Desulfobacula sp.]
MAFNLSLTFGPKWENVSNIRNFVTEMLSTGIVDINDAKKVATASSELVENVVKYSAAGGAMIDIKKDPGMGRIALTIKNIANYKHIDTFEAIYKKIMEGDPKEVYKKMMLRSFNDPDNSQLGLARIRYECQGEILYEISNDIKSIANVSDIDQSDDNLKLLSVTVEIPVKLFKI